MFQIGKPAIQLNEAILDSLGDLDLLLFCRSPGPLSVEGLAVTSLLPGRIFPFDFQVPEFDRVVPTR